MRIRKFKAAPFPAARAVPPEFPPDHQAASGPEPGAFAAPEPVKIAVCEGNARVHLLISCVRTFERIKPSPKV